MPTFLLPSPTSQSSSVAMLALSPPAAPQSAPAPSRAHQPAEAGHTPEQPPLRGVRERFKSLTSRNKEFKKSLKKWPDAAGIASNKIKWAKQLSTGNLDLSNIDLTSLPPNINQLRMLRCLDLKYNQLEEVPGIEQMPPRLVRLVVLGNPLKTLPPSFGQFLQFANPLFDKKKPLMTIPLQTSSVDTGVKISLEFEMYPSYLKDDARNTELKKNYSFMRSLSWDGKPEEPQLSPYPIQRDSISDSSDESEHGSTGAEPKYLTQMSSAFSDNTTPYDNQDLLGLRDRLRTAFGVDSGAEFTLNAIIVHHSR